MPEENLAIAEYVAVLKSKIPPMEHGALESRLEGLLNDSSATEEEVIAILREEFDPAASRKADTRRSGLRAVKDPEKYGYAQAGE